MRGKIIRDELPGGHKYSVYLPDKFQRVMYFLHGSNSDSGFWDDYYEIMERFAKDGDIPSTAGAALSVGNSYWVDSEKYGAVESRFIKEFIPHMQERFGFCREREQVGITGCSMGGYGAVRYGLTYPNLFSQIILLSPAVQQTPHPLSRAVTGGGFGESFSKEKWNRLNYPAALESYMRNPLPLSCFIIAGDKDYNYASEPTEQDKHAERYNMEMQCVLLYQELCRKARSTGINAALRILGGGHNNRLWLDGFRQALRHRL